MAHSALMSRLIPIDVGQVIASNVADTANDFSATYAYIRGDEVAYNGRVYVSLTPVVTLDITLGGSQVDTGNDRFYKDSHGLVAGDRVALRTGGTLPNNLLNSVLYYVVNVEGPWFRVSLTEGGTRVDFTTAGTGTMTVLKNPNWGVTPGTDASKWLDSRAVNKMAMFDNVSVTRTTNATSIVTQVTPGSRFDGVDFFGLVNVTDIAVRVAEVGPSHSNQFLWSEAIDNAAWTKSGASVTPNAIRASTGAMIGDLVAENNANAAHYFQQASAASLAGSANVVTRIEAKAGLRNWIYATTTNSAGASLTSWINLATGATGTVAAGHTISITDLGDGWYRIVVMAAQGASAGAFTARFGLATGNNVTTYPGVVIPETGAYFTRAQLEAAAGPSPYIPTTTAAVTTTLNTIYDKSFDMSEAAWDDSWYNPIYDETVYKDRLSLSDIDPSGATNSAFITLSGTNVECGSCLFGLSRDIGGATYGADVGIDNWSRVTRDDWGGVQIDATRGYSDNASYTVWFSKSKAAALRRMLADYKDTPAVYRMARSDTAPGGWDTLGCHHAISSFRIVMEGPCGYLCRLELEGIT